ncbi:lantibiotic dehydratase [Deinococcus roseus]|uniref:Lantibiotic dehydratase N-terminal domain-containing protein n=1 Tax=Deinococcus roseus TaxID=392414 RepID=A0ABQ2DBW9_9DEIO|nr:lantibiotic dehydratase [Deinococcus roseus]GGJ52773.1 hypothetical protein GCM10008938_43430 [Deinococcus roseus]
MTQAIQEPSSRHSLQGTFKAGTFKLWPFLCVRGAGFPVDWALSLSAAGISRQADLLNAKQNELQRVQEKTLQHLRAQLEASPTRTPERDRLVKWVRALQQGRCPESDSSGLQPFREALQAVQEQQDAYQHTFQQDMPEVTRTLQELALKPLFQEAVLWQNRRAFQSGIQPLLNHQPGLEKRSSQVRQHEQMVASYLQRYSLKNDSIGFFGPIGWGGFQQAPFQVLHKPGKQLLKRRQVYWEGWALDAFARSLSSLPGMQPWLPPRLKSFVGFEGTTLTLPGRPGIPLDVPGVTLLKLCNGERSAQQIADLAAQQGVPAQQVYGLFSQLQQQGLLDWSFRAPLEPHAERYLLSQLQQIGDPGLKKLALGQLEQLEQGRQAVQEAHGNPEKLNLALGKLDEVFQQITGQDTTRGAGRNYAGRTLVYEDCQRDLHFEVGQLLLDRLGPALELLLVSGNWATAQLGRLYRQVFHGLYQQIAAALGQQAFDIAVFWQQAQPLMLGPDAPAKQVLHLFQQKWAEILDLDPESKQVHFTLQELEAKVRAAFDTPDLGWQSARYQCPDIMVSASSLEALQNGDYQLVMGEMHLAQNTQVTALFVQQHPDAALIEHLLETDIPQARLHPVPPEDWEGYTTRTSLGVVPGKDHRLIMSENIASTPLKQQIPIGDLVVELQDGQLIARTRDHRISFDLIEAVAEGLNEVAVDFFRLLAEKPHQPRVAFGDLVVSRENWTVQVDALKFANLKAESSRFLEARRWAASQGLPRLVFVKTPVEGKPFFVDFDSPVYVELFCKAVRRTQEAGKPSLKISEMLPTPENTWLTDHEGHTYTCEMRCVVVRQEAQEGHGEHGG